MQAAGSSNGNERNRPLPERQNAIHCTADRHGNCMVAGNVVDETSGVRANHTGWFDRLLSTFWYRSTTQDLHDAELALLSNLKNDYRLKYVNIGPMTEGGGDVMIWTYFANEDLVDQVPLVLVHGMGSGLALWCLNLDELAGSRTRPVYALDLPGFGRSSRPTFATEPEEVEHQFVAALEAWRISMGLTKMVLVGHSLGGYLCFAYSLKIPMNVAHLICVDPWGFTKQPKDFSKSPQHVPHHSPLVCMLPVNPLWPVRFAAPFGTKIIRNMEQSLIRHFTGHISDPWTKIANYVFHMNVQNPTGETAFSTLMSCFGWAKCPMQARIEQLDKNIPLTLIYGDRSWIDHYPPERIVERRRGSYVDYHILRDAGHNVYADLPDIFNELVLHACRKRLN